MPLRNDEEYEQRRQQIIAGALKVFAEKGFEKATNRDIADAAGIRSPGLVYHYFKNKRDLLRCVLEERAVILHFLRDSDQVVDLPPREALGKFAQAFFQIAALPEAAAFSRVFLGEALHQADIAAMMTQMGFRPTLDFIQRYLAHQMDLGHLRRVDVEVAATSFVGSLFFYIILQIFSPDPGATGIARAGMVEGTVDLFLKGLEL